MYVYIHTYIYLPHKHLSIRVFCQKRRSWFDTDPFLCKREQKERKKFINKRKFSNEKPRVKIYENCQEGIFFVENIWEILCTHDFRRNGFSVSYFFYCACEKWRQKFIFFVSKKISISRKAFLSLIHLDYEYIVSEFHCWIYWGIKLTSCVRTVPNSKVA